MRKHTMFLMNTAGIEMFHVTAKTKRAALAALKRLAGKDVFRQIGKLFSIHRR